MNATDVHACHINKAGDTLRSVIALGSSFVLAVPNFTCQTHRCSFNLLNKSLAALYSAMHGEYLFSYSLIYTSKKIITVELANLLIATLFEIGVNKSALVRVAEIASCLNAPSDLALLSTSSTATATATSSTTSSAVVTSAPASSTSPKSLELRTQTTVDPRDSIIGTAFTSKLIMFYVDTMRERNHARSVELRRTSGSILRIDHTTAYCSSLGVSIDGKWVWWPTQTILEP
jgi:hypothetical protein